MAAPDPNPPTRANFLPLLALIVICVSIAAALDVGYGGAVGMTFHSSIGFFLCSLAIIKLLDLKRFVEGFAAVDLAGRQLRAFGYLWPFIELALGEAFFTFFNPPIVYWITRIVGLYLILSGFLAMRRGIDRSDLRLGNALRLPLPMLMLTEGVILFGLSFILLWL
jgi:hypothetical protein